MNNIRGTITVEIHPTETASKVEKAISNFFTYTAIKRVPKRDMQYLIIKIDGRDGLMKFYERLRQERICNVARKVMLEGISGNFFTFYLNKQAAFMNHISFCEPKSESSLGPICVELQCDDANQLINWLTLRTS
jgi:predicted RNA binding protein with dsRBD fold (UPF0201 family)